MNGFFQKRRLCRLKKFQIRFRHSQILELDYVTHLRPDCHGEVRALAREIRELLEGFVFSLVVAAQVMIAATFARFLVQA